MTPTKQTKGFAIALQPDTDLGLAMLIAEDEEGRNEPVAVVSTIREAEEMAKIDFRERMRGLESGKREPLCPALYKLWARGIDGVYQCAREIEA